MFMLQYFKWWARPEVTWPTRLRWTRWEAVLCAGLLALALLLRVVALDDIPPGMQHDEVFDARFATEVLSGARPVFFDANTGVPPLFPYLVAGAFALLGRSVIVLRLTSALIGVAGMGVSYLLLRELAGRKAALLALAGLTVSFWHLLDSRIGIEPIIVPLMTSLSFYVFWRALRSGRLVCYTLAGLSMGVAQYAHRTGPLIPLTIVAFVAYLLIARRSWLQGENQRISVGRGLLGVALASMVAGLVAAPLLAHILQNPDASLLRVRQLSYELTALLHGDLGPILKDTVGVLGMFGLRGDPEWRYNVAGRPIFDPVTGLLFWLGVALTLARMRRPTSAFLLLWLPINLGAALVTSPSPASTRALGAIAAIYTMPAIALAAGWDWAGWRRARWLGIAVASLAGLLLAGNALWTLRDYFYVWPANEEVRSIYRADLAAAADFLDAHQPAGAVCISAQFAADLDAQTFDYTLRQPRQIKWFDGRQALVLPATPENQPVTYIFPATDPLSPAIEQHLRAAHGRAQEVTDRTGGVALQIYHLDTAQMELARDIEPLHPLGVNLGDEIDLIGYDLPQTVSAGESVDLVVCWRVRRGGHGDVNYAFFAHLLDAKGVRWAQDDPTGFPSHSWGAGDLVIQFFNLVAPADMPPGQYHIDLGVYAQGSGQRLARVEGNGQLGSDAFTLHPFAVTAPALPPYPEDLPIAETTNAAFGGRLALLGYRFETRVLNLDGRSEVWFFWRAIGDHQPDVEIELTLTDEYGQALPPIRRRLLDGDYPLEGWRAGQIVRDRFWLSHTQDIPRGLYRMELTVYDVVAGERLTLPDGRLSVALGEVFMRGLY
jgi:4-amino-4-deoxy-L-arabinose transferase-like glycosyltransferase